MDCQDLRRFLDAYLDGEIAEEECAEFAAHLRSCDDCDSLARFRERLKERMGVAALRVKAPGALRARIRDALDAEDDAENSWAARWLWRAIPAAAAVLLIVGGFFSQRSEVANLAEQSVEWHQTDLPLDVAGPDVGRIRRFLSEKVPFAVRLPGFRTKDVQLEGARLSSIGGRRAAYVRYRIGDRKISVFIVDPRVLPSASEAAETDLRVRWEGVRGYNVGVYTVGGTGYAVTSDMDRRRLIRLIGQLR